MARVATIRVTKELKNLHSLMEKGEYPEFTITPNIENVLEWHIKMKGPSDTPYEKGMFNLKIVFTSEYPFKAPDVKFLTKVYHPNINTKGEICLKILKDSWASNIQSKIILEHILTLFKFPNPDDPLDASIANLYKTNSVRFNEQAKAWTETYAK